MQEQNASEPAHVASPHENRHVALRLFPYIASSLVICMEFLPLVGVLFYTA